MNITLATQRDEPTGAESSKRAKLADAAQQFEAMMLQELLKPMRTSEDDLGGEKREDGSFDTIASFGTESVAKAIAAHGGLGIANLVLRHLSGDSQGSEIQKNSETVLKFPGTAPITHADGGRT